jgi:hypothetical protein
MTEKEKTLIAGCLRNEKAAWDSFVLQYSNLVYHTIKKTLIRHHAEPHADVVEDLYQDSSFPSYETNTRSSGSSGVPLAVAWRVGSGFLQRG